MQQKPTKHDYKGSPNEILRINLLHNTRSQEPIALWF